MRSNGLPSPLGKGDHEVVDEVKKIVNHRNPHVYMQTKRCAETKSLLQWEKVPRNEADEVFLGKTTIFDTSSPHLGAMSSPTGEGLVHGKPLINTTKCNDQKSIVFPSPSALRLPPLPKGEALVSNSRPVCAQTNGAH